LRIADCGLRAGPSTAVGLETSRLAIAFDVLATAVNVVVLLSSNLATAADSPDQAVLAAEAERVAVVERICRPTLAIFDSGGQGGGSGVLISSDGYALTNFHVVAPTGLTSGRALFNLDWITLSVMFVIALVGAIFFLIARPDRKVAGHLHDELEPTGAERHS
jgi:hypothetical protein